MEDGGWEKHELMENGCFHFLYSKKKKRFQVGYTYSSEKAMAPHSSILAWNIPWMEEPGGLQSMGLQRDGHD